jgi:hypothetical protein
MKIRPVAAELFHANRWTDGRTDGLIDMMKPIVAFRNFAKSPKNGTLRIHRKNHKHNNNNNNNNNNNVTIIVVVVFFRMLSRPGCLF